MGFAVEEEGCRDRHVSAISGPDLGGPAGTNSSSGTYRHATSRDALPQLEGVSTLFELFDRSVKQYPDNECLGARTKGADGSAGPFVFKSYKEIGAEVADLASGLIALGVRPGARIGVLAANCPEWMVAMQVCGGTDLSCER